MSNKFGFIFIMLFALAALALAGAWWAVGADNDRRQKRVFEPRLLFPTLADQLDGVGAIRIDVGKGLAGIQRLTFMRPTKNEMAKNEPTKNDFFRIIERGSYIARQDMIRRLMVGMAGLEIIEPRSTTRAGHQRLGLLPPEKLGPSVRITFFDRGRSKIADLLIGNRPEGLGDVLGQSSVYVRKTGEKQAWLARGALPLRLDAVAWLDLTFFKRLLGKKIDEQDFIVAKAQFQPFGQSAWRITRSDADRAFSLTDQRGVPVRGVVNAQRVNHVAGLLNGLVFQDVRPAKDFRFRRRRTVIYESFSGLAIVFEIIRSRRGYWARINARATARRAQIRAQDLERYLDGYAFLLPQKTARQMMLPTRAFFKDSAKKRRKKPVKGRR